MQIYRVYQHPQQGFLAIASGFNWPAAVFSLIWTLSNSLWGPSALLLLGWGSVIAGILTAGTLKLPMLALTFVGIGVLLPLWSGMKAMSWLESRLQKQGYTLVNKIRARTPQGAITTAQQKLNPAAARGRTTAHG